MSFRKMVNKMSTAEYLEYEKLANEALEEKDISKAKEHLWKQFQLIAKYPELAEFDLVNRETTSDLIKSARDISNSLAKMERSSSSKELIAEAINLYKMQTIDEELKATGLNIFRDSNIRIPHKALQDKGIINLYQLSRMTTEEISEIPRVGSTTAENITNFIETQIKLLHSRIKLKIDMNLPNSRQDSFLLKLFSIKSNELLQAQIHNSLSLKDEVDELLDELGKEREKKITSVKKREEANKKVKKLEGLVRDKLSNIPDLYTKQSTNIQIALDTALEKFLNSRDDSSELIAKAYDDFQKESIAYYTMMEIENQGEHMSGDLPAELVQKVNDFTLDQTFLKATLRNYQSFGAKYLLYQKRTLLGDDTGLGKTVQILAAIADLKAKGKTHFLIDCPTSLIPNWEREVKKHTELEPIVIEKSARFKNLAKWEQDGGIAITSHSLLPNMLSLYKAPIDMFVVDEAHHIKNPTTARSMAANNLLSKVEYACLATGTPLENRVGELCALVGMVNREVAKEASKFSNYLQRDQFKQSLAPCYLRRLKTDVLAELPELIETEDWIEMNDAELRAYAIAIKEGNFAAARQVSWDVSLPYSGKAARVVEICDEAKEDNRKVVIFSSFLEPLRKLEALLGSRVVGTIQGKVSSDNRQKMVDKLDASEAGSVLLSQITTGGEGLNMQSASVVILADLPLKPSTEIQAISRVHRMGQTKTTLVHRLLCLNTVDERVLELLQYKQIEISTYANESAIGKLSQEPQWVKDLMASEKEKLGKSESELLKEAEQKRRKGLVKQTLKAYRSLGERANWEKISELSDSIPAALTEVLQELLFRYGDIDSPSFASLLRNYLDNYYNPQDSSILSKIEDQLALIILLDNRWEDHQIKNRNSPISPTAEREYPWLREIKEAGAPENCGWLYQFIKENSWCSEFVKTLPDSMYTTEQTWKYVDKMNAEFFTAFCFLTLKELGYQNIAYVSALPNLLSAKKDDKSYVIACKIFQSAMREEDITRIAKNLQIAVKANLLWMTTAVIKSNVRDFAKAQGVSLWGWNDFASLLTNWS